MMVMRRKHKVPHYRDGGAVPVDNVVIVAPEAAAEPVPMTAADIPADDGNPLTHALQAHDRAEAMQRDARASAVDHHINSIPGLSEHKRQFLRENPDLLRGDVAPHVAQAHQAALAAGIADDTPEMNSAVMNSVVRAMQQQRRDTMPDRSVHQMAADLDREAERVQHEAERPIAARRSIPLSAPVSRGIPSMSGQPRQPSNTLSAEERDIARRSFTDPNMSSAEKELLYLKNRNRYRQMKASGEYSDQGNG